MINFNKGYHYFFSNLILVLISLSFVVSDWMWGIFTFSEYIIGMIIALLIFTRQFKITKDQTKWIMAIIIFLTIHLIFQENFNELFKFKMGLAAFIKLIFYIFSITIVYNYIDKQNLRHRFLVFNNFMAIITCLLGYYIAIGILSEGAIQYEFLWNFTRSDITSYIFNNGQISFVRLKSVFSEPSYFGFYLNTILAMNYLNSNQIKINQKFSIAISITILLTFSYSAIAVMLLITSYYIYSTKKEWLKVNMKRVIVFGLILSLILSVLYIIFPEFFNYVFFQRTIDIFTDINNSGYSRLFGSWQYVNKTNFWLGNGLGHTPSIWNIYAYMISDLGVFGLIVFIFFTGVLLKSNKGLGLVFIVMNFSKGGYLSSSFWLFLLMILVYSTREHKGMIKT